MSKLPDEAKLVPWDDALARARADVAAARVHELGDVLRELESDLAAMENEKRAKAGSTGQVEAAALNVSRSFRTGR